MIPRTIKELQTYNVNLAEKLHKLGYQVIAAYDSKPRYKYKENYSYIQQIDYLQQSHASNTNVCIVVNNFIVLDVDKEAEVIQLKKLSKKYNVTSNQVIRTRNGFHVYYAVNYAVKSQNDNENKISIKCNGMSNTAPEAYRESKQFIYKPLHPVIKTTELNIMPEPMFRELRPAPKINPAPEAKPRTNTNFNYSKFNLTVAEYLAKLNINDHLNGDRLKVWLQILGACKATGEPRAFEDCWEWSTQGEHKNMTRAYFIGQWNSAEEKRNGYSYLHTLTNTNTRQK